MTKLAAFSILVGLVAVGCSDDDTKPTTATASGVFPTSGFTGRQMTVEITGDATTWSGTPTVTMGDGITVGSVTVASPTDLFADITIADGASIGKRDVSVMADSKTYTLTQAFELRSPVTATMSGTVAQGSVVSYSLRQLDFEAPFDSTCGLSFLGICFQYANLTVTSPTGTLATVENVADYTVSGHMFIDVDAAAAGGALTVTSGPSGSAVTSTLGMPVAIAARQATALTAGTAANGMITNPGDSGLFSFSASADTSVPFTVTTQAVQPSLYLLPASGHFADLLSTGANDSQGNTLLQLDGVADTAQTFYVIYVDDGSAVNYSVKAAPVTLTAVAEADTNGANNAGTTAQLVSKTGLVTGGTLNGVSDVDWYKFTIAAGDIGKAVHVTTSGDPLTDVLVDVYTDPAGANSLGESPDATYQEDFVSDPIPAASTTIYVKISASQAGFFNSSHEDYVAAIWLE